MTAKFSDQEIQALIQEKKPLPFNFHNKINLRDKRGHKERELTIDGVHGNQFQLILRQSDYNPMDFSVILAHVPSDTNKNFRLRRYNGKSHEHTNKIELKTFYDFHIHQATKRYQDSGFDEDTFAEPTDRYADFYTALDCMLKDCGFDLPPGEMHLLFAETTL